VDETWFFHEGGSMYVWFVLWFSTLAWADPVISDCTSDVPDPSAAFKTCADVCTYSAGSIHCDLNIVNMPGSNYISKAIGVSEVGDVDYVFFGSADPATFGDNGWCCAVEDIADEVSGVEVHGTPRQDRILFHCNIPSVHNTCTQDYQLKPMGSAWFFDVKAFGGSPTTPRVGADDRIYGSPYDEPGYAETLIGEEGNDYLYGYAGDDTLFGGQGADALWGYDGADWLVGGEGADVLYGHAGFDYLFGDGGNDRLSGGADSDLLCDGYHDDVDYFLGDTIQPGDQDYIFANTGFDPTSDAVGPNNTCNVAGIPGCTEVLPDAWLIEICNVFQ
jgi:hypothetical protein